MSRTRSSELDTRKQNPLRRLADVVFGFDFFISYAHDDGPKLPRGLFDALVERGYAVCLDEKSFHAGQKLSILTRRRVRASRVLVVVARPLALESPWVRREVEEAQAAERDIVVLDVRETFAQADAAGELKQMIGDDRLRVTDPSKTMDHAPKGLVVEQIVSSFRGVRQERRRERIIGATLIVLVILATVAAFAAWSFFDQLQSARQNLAQAFVNQAETSRQRRRPNRALRFAVEALRHEDNDAARRLLTEMSPLRRLPDLHVGESSVVGVDVTPAGAVLVAGCEDGQLVRFGAKGRQVIGRHPGLDSIAVSGDGEVVVTGGADGVVRWTREGEAWRREVMVRRSDELDVHFHDVHRVGAGRTFAFVLPTERPVVRIEDLTAGIRREIPLPLEGGSIQGHRVSPEGDLLALSLSGGEIELIDTATGSRVAAWQDPRQDAEDWRIATRAPTPGTMRFSSRGKRLAVATYSSESWVFDVSVDPVKLTFLGLRALDAFATLHPSDHMESVSFLGEQQRVVGINGAGLMVLWDFQADEVLGLAEPFEDSDNAHFTCMAVPTNGRFSAVGGSDGVLRRYDLAGAPLRYHFRPRHFADGEDPESAFTAPTVVAKRRDGALLIGCGDGSVRVWDYRDTDSILAITPRNLDGFPDDGHNGHVRVILETPDAGVLSAGGDYDLSYWSRTLMDRQPHELPFGPVHAVASSRGERVVLAGPGSEVLLWDVARRTRSSLRHPVPDDGSCEEVAFLPGEQGLAVRASYPSPANRRIYVWSTFDEKPERFPLADDVNPSAMAFSRRRVLAVADGTSGMLQLWERMSAEPRLRFALANLSGPVSFSPSGDWLVATRSEDLVVVRVDDGKEMAQLAGHGSQISGVFFAEEHLLVSWSMFDETVRVWDLSALTSDYETLRDSIEDLTHWTLQGFRVVEAGR